MRRRAKALFVVVVLFAFFGLSAASLADSPPTVTIEAPTEVAYTTAHVSGTVNPNGGPSNLRYFFETSTESGNPGSWSINYSTNTEIAGAEAEATSPIPVEMTMSGLQPGTEYAIRLVAENDGGRVETEAPYPSFTTEPVAPPNVSIDPAGAVTATTAELSGAINPEAPAGNPSAFDVNWHFECTPGCSSTGGFIAADSSSHPVSETLTGLEPDTEYQATLVAANVGAQESAGPISFTTEAVAPSVQTLYAGELGSGSATLAGRINSHNSEVEYQFEWGEDTGYGNTSPAAPEALGASDSSYHVVTADLTGLQEGSTYHFRLVATNSATEEVTQGEDHTFTTLAAVSEPTCPNAEARVAMSALLPSCRAYEQVSPKDKEYGVFHGEPFFALAAEEAGAAAFTTYGPLPGSVSGTLQNIYYSQRGPDGWEYTPLSPPNTPIPGNVSLPQAIGLSKDLADFFVLSANPPLDPAAQENIINLYMRDQNSGQFELLSPLQEEDGHRPFMAFAGESQDKSHFVFESLGQILPGLEVPGGVNNAVYEVVNGETRLASILPSGEIAQNGQFGSPQIENSISDDGSRIFFTATGNNELPIFVRENGTETIEASKSQKAVPDPRPTQTHLWGAASDGSAVYFTSPEELTEDANTGRDAEGNQTYSGNDLYRFDVESEELEDLTANADPRNPDGANVQGLLGVSDDGSYAYFVAKGALAGDAAPGQPNLYVWHNGATKFIATLSEADQNNWSTDHYQVSSRVSPDGRHVLLTSTTQLTAYDNADAGTETPDSEIYLYSSDPGEIRCVSCRTDGSAPRASTAIEGWTLTANKTRYMSDNGATVAFETSEPLVPQDSNGKTDVYQFSQGRPHLLSSGSGQFAARYGDMSADGTDIFFGTAEQLLGSDEDGYPDLYDARAGGGFVPPPPPIPPCSGGECVRNSSTPPPAPTLGSSTFAGAGNAKPGRRCVKGAHLVKRHGRKRCLKKHHKRSRKHRTSGGNK